MALLPLRDANAFAATARGYKPFAATPQATARAACVSSLSDFIQVECDTRHAPPPLREAVLLRLAGRIARLPATSRIRACIVLARQVAQLPDAGRLNVCGILAGNMDSCSLRELFSMLDAIGAEVLGDAAVSAGMASEIRSSHTLAALDIVALEWRARDRIGERLPLVHAVERLSRDAHAQVTLRAIIKGFQENAVKALAAIREKL